MDSPGPADVPSSATRTDSAFSPLEWIDKATEGKLSAVPLGRVPIPREEIMPSMTYGAGGQTLTPSSRAQSADCAHLHSAFGPGCPYCRPAAAGNDPDGPARQTALSNALPYREWIGPPPHAGTTPVTA